MKFKEIQERARCKAEAREVSSLGLQYFKRMTMRERDVLSASIIDAEGKVTVYSMVGHKARLVALSWVDEAGKAMTTEAELGEWSPEIVDALYDEARKVNGLADEAVEEAAKN